MVHEAAELSNSSLSPGMALTLLQAAPSSVTVLSCASSGKGAICHSNSSAYQGERNLFICCSSLFSYLKWLTKIQVNDGFGPDQQS